MKVSIVTICYNSDKTIEETIKSVLNQDYENIEYIIKDGLSKDGTLKIVEKYKERFNGRIKIYSTKDTGLYDAMNEGISYATGNVIGILNSDDIFANNHVISDIVSQFKQKNCDAVYGDLVFMDEKTMTLPIRNFIAGKRKSVLGWHMPHPTLYLKSNIYDEIGNFKTNFRIASDLDFMYRMMSKKYKISYLREYIVKMRAGGASTKGIKGYIKNLKEAYIVTKENNKRFPAIITGFRVAKTIFQGINAKIFKAKIIMKLENSNK